MVDFGPVSGRSGGVDLVRAFGAGREVAQDREDRERSRQLGAFLAAGDLDSARGIAFGSGDVKTGLAIDKRRTDQTQARQAEFFDAAGAAVLLADREPALLPELQNDLVQRFPEFAESIMSVTPESLPQAKARFLDADQLLRAEGIDRVPSGFRRLDDGNLEFIPGGPSDPAVRASLRGPGSSVTLADGTRLDLNGGSGVVTQPLTKSTTNAVQKDLIQNLNLLGQLEAIDTANLDEILTLQGRAIGFGANAMDAIGQATPGSEAEAFINKREDFAFNVNMLFNAYRKLITGAAASEKELQALKDSFLNQDLTPAVFRARFRRYKQELKRGIRLARRLLREGVPVGTEEGGKAFDVAFASGSQANSADDGQAYTEELRAQGVSEEEIDQRLLREGYID